MSLRAGKSVVMSERGNLFAMLMKREDIASPAEAWLFPARNDNKGIITQT